MVVSIVNSRFPQLFHKERFQLEKFQACIYSELIRIIPNQPDSNWNYSKRNLEFRIDLIELHPARRMALKERFLLKGKRSFKGKTHVSKFCEFSFKRKTLSTWV